MRKALRIGLVAATAVAATVMAGSLLPANAEQRGAPGASPGDGDPLDKHDRELLNQAQARGEQRVTILVATKGEQTSAVRAAIAAQGGTVGYVHDKIGYVRASVPLAAVEKTAKLPSVDALDVDEILAMPNPRETGQSARTQAAAAPGPTTPDANPFMPTRETGAVAFKQDHPTWDGRGITIGVMDLGVDLDHPALARTTTGERKIVDSITVTAPLTGLFGGTEHDPTWRAMITAVTGPTFAFDGRTWTAPAGTFRISVLVEGNPALGGELGNDVNRDGDTTDRFGVLYDPANNNIWVDADNDADFTDDPAMRPYKEQFQVGHFGTDNPATAVRDQLPFVVEFREDVPVPPTIPPLPATLDFVNIGIVSGAHGTHVAGIAAANGLFGGTMDGAAPGAKIVSARACLFVTGCTSVALAEGMIDLVANRGVHVVNMSIGGLPALNDGNNARAQTYNRLIDQYGVQMFISAGNSGPGINTAGDPGLVTDVMSVGSSISKESWLANYGSVVSSRLNMHNFSSRGPREDGGLKPDITAPGSAVSSVPMWQPGQPVPEAGYALPPGYGMFNGTSMASPQAAGAAALLLSASIATGTPVTPPELRQAIRSAANYNREVPAYAQGFGQFDTAGAWRLLRNNRLQPRNYTVDAPVCTPLSAFLEPANRGPGIHNSCAPTAGGHRAGESKTYTVTVTRTSGPAGNTPHLLSWLGNDGTFRAPPVVLLPLNQPRQIQIQARPAAGMHGAVLRIDDPRSPGVDHQLSATVVAATELTAANQFTWTVSGTVQRNRTQSFYLAVPAGVSALQVVLSGIATASQTRFIAFHPFGLPVDSTSSVQCYTNFSNPAVCNPFARGYASPTPGVWEIEVESRRTSPFLQNPFTLTVKAQGVALNPPLVNLENVPLGQPTALSFGATNQFAPVAVTAGGGALSSAVIDRPSIAHLATMTRTVEVPAGATVLEAVIGNPADPAADLDLFVQFGGRTVGQSADGDSEEAVRLVNPAPGTYTIVIDGFNVPAGTTAFDYRDAYFAPGLGTLTASGSANLGPGGTAQFSGSVTALVAPVPGRSLAGELRLVNEFGTVVGRGFVVVRSTTG